MYYHQIILPLLLVSDHITNLIFLLVSERVYRPPVLLRPALSHNPRLSTIPSVSVLELDADFRDIQIKQIQGFC